VPTILTYAILLTGAFLMIAPLLAMIIDSLQTGRLAQALQLRWAPGSLTLVNYARLFEHTHILRWFLNSLLVAGVGTGLAVLSATTTGYVFARMAFPLKNVVFWSFLAMLMIPEQITLIPQYILLVKLHWLDSYQALVLPGVTSAFGTFLIRQYLQAIPSTFEEASRIDGATELQVYWHVILPLVRPAMATLAAVQFLNYWNEFLYPLVVTTSSEMRTLPVGLATLQRPSGGLPEILAGTTLATVPTVVVFLFFQRYLVRGLITSGVKG
jgi:multiple sugar transport system permease protein